MSGGSNADASYNEDEDYNNPSSKIDNAAIAREISDSLRKMNKLVNNLMARADCVPFREPVDWKGLGVSWCYCHCVYEAVFIVIFSEYFIAKVEINFENSHH